MAIATLAPIIRYLDIIHAPEPDAALLSRFAGHADEAAFAELVRRHGPAVLGVCRRVLRDEHAAEDAFQVAFLLLAKKAGSLRDPERLACWLHGVAYRTALKQRSWLMRRRLREQPINETKPAAPNEADPDLSAEIDAAIQQLPTKYRIPVVLCYLQGLTNAQAAAAVGCPANTIATRLARARARLRDRLTKQGLTVAVSATLVTGTARSAVCLVSGMNGLSNEITALMEGVRIAMLWKKIKVAVATVAILALSGVGVGRLGYHATAQQPANDNTQKPAATAPTPPMPPPADQSADAGDRIPAVDAIQALETSRNFVVTGTDPRTAHRIAQAAERYRREIARSWLGRELPNWEKPCPIHVEINDAQPSGATVFDIAHNFSIQSMRISGTLQHILKNDLPHEITHVVLADDFRAAIPRWADEGAAEQNESEIEQQRYDRTCRDFLKQGRAYRLSSLFAMHEYPSDSLVLFAESYSVVQFLIELKGHAKFLKFVKAGSKGDWDAAVKRFYDFDSVSDLERGWIDSLSRNPDDVTSSKLKSRTEVQSQPVPQTIPAPIEPPSVEIPQSVIPSPQAPTVPASQIPQPQPGTFVPNPTFPQAPVPSVVQGVDLPLPTPIASDMPPTVSQPSTVPPQANVPPHQAPSMIPFEWQQWQIPLTVVDVSLDGEIIVVKFPKKTVYEPITTFLQTASGARTVTSYVGRSVQEEYRYQRVDIEAVGVDGKKLPLKDLAKRLAKETPAILVENQKFDSRLISLLKPDTLIISAPKIASPGSAVLQNTPDLPTTTR